MEAAAHLIRDDAKRRMTSTATYYPAVADLHLPLQERALPPWRATR